MEGKTEEEKEIKSEGRRKTGFQKNKFKEVIDVQVIADLNKHGQINHDIAPILEFADVLGAHTYNDHTERTSEPVEEVEWKSNIRSMLCLLMAKKMASSLSESDSLENVKSADAARRLELQVPTAVMPVINHYGKVRDETHAYDIMAQPFLVLNYLMYGVHPTRLADATFVWTQRAIPPSYVNRASPATFRFCISWLSAIVNSWARVANPYPIGIGGVNCIVGVPLFVSGAAAYRGLIANAQPPPEVITRLEQIEYLERVYVDGFVWAVGETNIARALGIIVVNFNRDDFDLLIANYGRVVQPMIIASLQAHYVIGVVKGVSDVGSLGQVVRRQGGGMGHSPEPVPDGSLNLGWMLSGLKSFTVVDPERFSVIGSSTPLNKMVSYVQAMRKSKV